jgi:PAS domain S-box-containing protein
MAKDSLTRITEGRFGRARRADGAAALPAPSWSLTGPAEVTLPETFLDKAPPLYFADKKGKVVFANTAFRELAKALFGTDAKPGEAPESLRRVFERLDASHPDLVERQSVELAGETRHFRAHHFVVAGDGQVSGFGGVYTDVTHEARALGNANEAEARFRDIIRSTSDWVWETDANLNLTYVSDRITEALEILPRALIGRNLFMLGTFEERPGAAPVREQLMRDFPPFRSHVFLMRDSRGETRHILLSGVPVFEQGSGRFKGYRGTGTDNTVRHRAEQGMRNFQRRLQESLAQLQERNAQLDEAVNRAEAAARAKTEFLGKMSHELRTPLNAVIGFSEMAVQQVFGPLNDRYLGYFRDIRGAAYHLLNIINDILDAVSVESERVHVDLKPVGLAALIEEAKALVAVRAEQEGIDLTAVRAEPHWSLHADPVRTRQILVNLLNNAVKFTPRGGRIGIEVRDADKGAVAITVWDTGIGIPPDQHERIFESFHQVGSDLLTAPREGTGLGLSVSRQLARLMHGDVTVDSTPGQGSRFTVTLPRARPAVQAKAG